MTKRVGITASPNEREVYWTRKYPSLRNFEVVERDLTYDQAQRIENDYIARGYEGSPGGRPVRGNDYIVYIFDY